MRLRHFFLAATLVGLALAAPATAAAGLKKDMAFAVSLARKGLWNEAAFRFLQLSRANPHNPRIWSNLAVAYEAAQKYEKAAEAYEKAASLGATRLEPFAANLEAFESFYAEWNARREGREAAAAAPPEESESAPDPDQEGTDGR